LHLVDTHCHLTDRRLAGQLQAVLNRAGQAGVTAIVSATSSVADSQAAAELVAKLGAAEAPSGPRIACTAGVHPHEAKGAESGYLDSLRRLSRLPGCAGIGEIGLDYHYDFSPRDVQRRVFAQQLQLALEEAKPVVIHTREAFADTLAILEEAKLPPERLLFHSFTGGPAEAAELVRLGCYVSFSGIATFAKAGEIRDSARLVPAERILAETDAPYLSPEPVRRLKTNEPANVAHVVACLAAARGESAETLARQILDNARRFFGEGDMLLLG